MPNANDFVKILRRDLSRDDVSLAGMPPSNIRANIDIFRY